MTARRVHSVASLEQPRSSHLCCCGAYRVYRGCDSQRGPTSTAQPHLNNLCCCGHRVCGTVTHRGGPRLTVQLDRLQRARWCALSHCVQCTAWRGLAGWWCPSSHCLCRSAAGCNKLASSSKLLPAVFKTLLLVVTSCRPCRPFRRSVADPVRCSKSLVRSVDDPPGACCSALWSGGIRPAEATGQRCMSL
jgi:hypothetical protein